jgi:2-dehydro-3-deoxygluconokinase
MGLFSAVETGSLAQVDDFRLGIGGSESNVAIGLARLGTPATWVGRVGADEVGERVQRELRAEGVDARAFVDPEAPTGLMVKSRPAGSVVRVAYYRAGSAGSRLSPEGVDAEMVTSAALLHVTGITPGLSKTAAAAVDLAVEVAVEAGIPVSFDVNHRTSLWGERDAAPVYRALASRATVIFAGLEEARMLVDGDDAVAVAAALCDLGPTQVMLKLGELGCVAWIDGVIHRVPAVPVNVIDTVGAGDAFVAGYLSDLLAGASPHERLTTAVRAGAFACLGAGDWESYATRSALELLDAGDPVVR